MRTFLQKEKDENLELQKVSILLCSSQMSSSIGYLRLAQSAPQGWWCLGWKGKDTEGRQAFQAEAVGKHRDTEIVLLCCRRIIL